MQKIFTCNICGLKYKTKKLAEDCERYCKKNKSCSIELAKKAIK